MSSSDPSDGLGPAVTWQKWRAVPAPARAHSVASWEMSDAEVGRKFGNTWNDVAECGNLAPLSGVWG